MKNEKKTSNVKQSFGNNSLKRSYVEDSDNENSPAKGG